MRIPALFTSKAYNMKHIKALFDLIPPKDIRKYLEESFEYYIQYSGDTGESLSEKYYLVKQFVATIEQLSKEDGENKHS